MWSNLPFDLLANIFSFLSPDCLARARSACRHWNTCAKAYTPYTVPSEGQRRRPPWFLALPARCRGPQCYAYNPILHNWHVLPLDFVLDPVRPVAAICGLVLFRLTSSSVLQLVTCNPFTRQYRPLPALNIPRINPALGLIELGPGPGPPQPSPFPHFRVYVAGGTSEAPSGGAAHEATVEMYDSKHDMWQIIGQMRVEFAVRLTVWTPSEGVYSNGVLYWMTSARAYSIMGFEIGPNLWRELSVPMVDRLEFAALVTHNGKLTLVGSTGDGDASIWELGDDGWGWSLIGKVPVELGKRLVEGKGNWGSIKCAGVEGAVWLYRDLGAGMVVWQEDVDSGRWEWFWVEGCTSIRAKKLQNFPIKGVLLHPSLASSCLLSE
ncbi:hypothetical protein NMG60_11004925 [Bertholletia excelsa]